MSIDAKSEELLKSIHPSIADRWRQVASDMEAIHNLPIRITEGMRSLETQMEYWAKGRAKLPSGDWIILDKKSIITHAMPGQSMHHYGLGIDICMVGSNPYPKERATWEKYGTLLKKYGLVWGGMWVGPACDQPHCEDKFGLTTKEIQKIYEIKKSVKDVWDKIDSLLALKKEVK